jgi:hypothetical protein
MDLVMDADMSSAKGHTTNGLGADYLLEGNIANWYAPSIFTGKSQTDWNGFTSYSATNYYQLGYT